MRELTGHKVNPANDLLTVEALDGPGPGGASHAYRISGFDLTRNNAAGFEGPTFFTEFGFQNGPINEAGVNGITHEALLAILIDRLEGFQSGAYANDYNHAALMNLIAAQKVLQARTLERMARNVEGTHQA